jgi:hypothetical protein
VAAATGHLGQFAHRQPAGSLVEATCATRSSVTLSLTGLDARHLAGRAWPGLERSTICAAGRPPAGRAALVQPHLDPQRRGSMSRSTACPATTVEPGSASRLVTTPSAGASRRTLARCWAQAGALGRQALLVLPGCGQVGGGRGDAGLGRRLLLQPGLDGAGADEVLRWPSST